MNVSIWYKCIFVGMLASIILIHNGCHPAAEQSGASGNLDPALINGTRAFENVRQLVAFTPRNSGSEGCIKAAEHLHKALTPYTESCFIDVFEDKAPHGNINFRNVVGILPGSSSELVILASHYDTKSGISDSFQGANDSGSSSGLLLELARVLHEQKPLPYTVMFAFLDGEECIEKYGRNDGLHGSKRLVSQLKEKGELKNIKAMILLDMIGDRDLTLEIPQNVDKKLRKIALDAARSAGFRDKFSLSQNGILDDHQPFLDAGVPAIDLIDFKYGSKPGFNDYWHTDQDSMDKIGPESLQSVGEVVINMLNKLAENQ